MAGPRSEPLDSVDRALERDLGNPVLWIRKAQGLLARGRRREALDAAAAAEGCAPAQAALWDGIGTVRSFAQDQRGALAACERAVALEPDHPQFLFNRASVRRFLGDLEGAEADYDAVIALKPDDHEAYLNRSELRSQTSERNHVAELEKRLAAGAREWRGLVQIHYALAKELEDLGEHARAFDHLSRGAKCRRAHLRYDVANDLATVGWICAAFSGNAVPAAGAAPDDPVFIVGLPRSGTTLIERILAGHSALTPAGELECFAHAVVHATQPPNGRASLARKELIDRSAHIDFAALGRDYLHRARQATGIETRFVDKMPLNYLYCGMIGRALPNARIVHMERHPMAAGYAMYKTLFRGGYPFSYDLAEIGAYISGYRRLMQHWNETANGILLQVRYEDLVRDLERECRRTLRHCELEWQSECLRFESNPAASTTASASQIRRPLYRSSIDQWRHYERELAPLRAALIEGGLAPEELS